ncbi:sigma-54 interaction domain-containing protein [Aneurinibacillus tyrosinisolvens]|uniref:sigma-54 interaction domain-containing protein n=1 Tax=Aneurinibacillus tyrosinisolvens TaxID=1443435 RepID=UPI00063F7313|nr:sigma 54-interacting transcriptional regulator [Aneurinibacillus tyrosinisolvens]
MNTQIEWLERFPLPVLITNEQGSVQAYNHLFSGLCEENFIKAGMQAEEIFARWKTQSPDIGLVEIGNNHFIILHRNFTWSSENLLLYLLVDGSQVYCLKEQIAQLGKINNELDTIIENSYDVIYITDREGITLKTNSAIERVTGIPKKYYIGKNVNALVDRGILKETVTFKVVEQKKPVSVIQKNFAGRETLMTGSPIFNEAGEIEKVVTNIRDLSELNALQKELEKVHELNNQYKKELERLKSNKLKNENVIIESQAMKEIYDMSERIADFDATVLLLGETGVGKDVLARHIYCSGNRHEKGEFIKINCGAIPHELLESELFGYEAGAFTGANRTGKAGMFELAHKGVLFLDEVGEMPLALQVKLLRALQEKQIQRIGGIRPKNVDVRVIAATNRNLKEMVSQGEFREDLFYRLNVLPILIPPLRERRDDILPLIHYFLDKLNDKYAVSKQFDRSLREFLYHYAWPGNVREMANLVERLILTITSKVITANDLPAEYKENEKSPVRYTKITTLKEAVEVAERELLALAVKNFPSTYRMAEVLGTSQPTIVRKLKKYNF